MFDEGKKASEIRTQAFDGTSHTLSGRINQWLIENPLFEVYEIQFQPGEAFIVYKVIKPDHCLDSSIGTRTV